MKVTNTSGKIINVGKTVLLPGQAAEIDNSYASNSVIKMLKDTGALAIKETGKTSKKAESSTKSSKPDKPEAPSTEVK